MTSKTSYLATLKVKTWWESHHAAINCKLDPWLTDVKINVLQLDLNWNYRFFVQRFCRDSGWLTCVCRALHLYSNRFAMSTARTQRGAKLGRSWSQVGREVGPELGPKVGALLAKVDPKWSPCCGHEGSKRCIWTMLGRSAKCADCCTTPLLNSHASAPSVQEDLHESSCKIGKAPSRQSQIRHLLISQSSSTRS